MNSLSLLGNTNILFSFRACARVTQISEMQSKGKKRKRTPTQAEHRAEEDLVASISRTLNFDPSKFGYRVDSYLWRALYKRRKELMRKGEWRAKRKEMKKYDASLALLNRGDVDLDLNDGSTRRFLFLCSRLVRFDSKETFEDTKKKLIEMSVARGIYPPWDKGTKKIKLSDLSQYRILFTRMVQCIAIEMLQNPSIFSRSNLSKCFLGSEDEMLSDSSFLCFFKDEIDRVLHFFQVIYPLSWGGKKKKEKKKE